MSDLLTNSYRFSGANTARVDVVGKNRGQLTADGKYGFDCSGFLWYTLRNSGYDVGEQFWEGAKPIKAKTYYEKRSCLRAFLGRCSTKTYPKTTSNDGFWRVAA